MDVTLIAHLKPNYVSKSGSSYFYTHSGLYRLSNHWGRLGNCKWRLLAINNDFTSKTKLGYANWDNFYPDNDYENLYYLEVDYIANTVTYEHKNNPNYKQDLPLRTAKETMKRIKQIRNLLELTNWAKYYDGFTIEELRHIFIEELITTQKTLEEIKKI